MKIKLNRNLQIGYGVSLLTLIGVAVISFYTFENMVESAKLVDHSHLVIQNLEKTMTVMKDAETGQRGFLLTNEQEFLEPYTGAYEIALTLVDQTKTLTHDNSVQQRNMAELKDILMHRLDILHKLLDKRKNGRVVTLDDLRKGKLAMDALRRSTDKAERDENNLLQQRINELNKYTSLMPVVILLAVMFAIIIAGFSYVLVLRDLHEKDRLSRDLEVREQETVAINEELAATNEELMAMNEEYMASNEELTESREDLANLNSELEERVNHRTRALLETEKRFRDMMETIPQMAWTNTPEGEITFYNRRWQEYTGIDTERIKAKGWQAVCHADDLQNNYDHFYSILKQGIGGEFEVREKRHDGDYRWHLVRMMPVKADNDHVDFWVGTATDIHELKMLQQQKDDFISIASHELKTPITTLKASLQLLNRVKHNPASPALPDMIDRANASLNKVNKLIEELLNFSRFNQGQLNLNESKFTIAKLIDDCCQHVRLAGDYQILTSGETELEVFADPLRIEQVIINFVNNAIKYAPASKIIDIHIEKMNSFAKVSVSDHGKGIDPEKLPHLFDRYFRVNSSGSQYSGLGLGLYICAEIIKKHNGEIGVDSTLGQGSTFWFTLPL